MQFKIYLLPQAVADSIKVAILIQSHHESKGKIRLFRKSPFENWLNPCKKGKIQPH
ncbi:hypothetical protein NT05HA_2327 [Aggregatibacter aphrophilus NJ8700]|nr:hypothetical protein NT05HA_2327 [Aggregatibacter aphrophilus NJ8700]